LTCIKTFCVLVLVPVLLAGGLAACAPVRVLNAVASASPGYAVSADQAYGALPHPASLLTAHRSNERFSAKSP